MTPAFGKPAKRTDENGNGWKVHLFMHAQPNYIVWIRNGQDILKSLQTRKKVMFDNEDVTDLTQGLIPIDQLKKYEISSPEINECEFKNVDKFGKQAAGRVGKKLKAIVARLKSTNKNNIGMITFRDYISRQKALRANHKQLVRL